VITYDTITVTVSYQTGAGVVKATQVNISV
jgi:hypothetical protein